jgi:cephalosporin-C deacetylase-like acetyl esterase
MVEPDDFGLSPVQTLAHVGDPTRSTHHSAFWKAWSAGVFSHSPVLAERPGHDVDHSDPTATHQFESVRHVRIGCALALPAGRPRAGVVLLHGYGNVPSLAQTLEDWRELTERGLAVLAVRARGYPGSRLDAPDLAAASDDRGGGRWITVGLNQGLSDKGIGGEWVFSYAVADAVNACRALKGLLARAGARGAGTSVYVHGESFGGALGVIAASVLAEQDGVARLAIGVPGMGDWPWRLADPQSPTRPGAGSGRLIRECLRDQPQGAEGMMNILRVLDAAVHARRVRCPVLCKLALRDEMVPAPTAAAIFNGLGSAPGEKWRFVTRYGHFDGGIADARRHTRFDALARAFLDPSQEPLDSMKGVA